MPPSGLRDLLLADLRVDEVQLMELHRADRIYCWDVVKGLPLG